MRKSKLDILLISGAYPTNTIGGVATHVGYLARALSDLRKPTKQRIRVCNVHVLTTGQRKHSVGYPLLTIHELPGQNGHFASKITPGIGEVPMAEAIHYGLNNWQRIRADVIHAHDFDSIYIGMMLKAAFRVPLVATIHRSPKEWDPTLPQRNAKDCFVEALRLFRFVDWFVAPSKVYEKRLRAQNFRKIRRIFHGIPISRASRGTNDIIQVFNLPPNSELIFCPTRLDPYKNPEVLADAAAILRETLPERNLIFAFAGAGINEKYRAQLQELARSKLVEDIVRFGRADGRDVHPLDMATLYRRSTICVVPSRLEGFGQVVLEAFAFRRAVVGSNTGGIAELIKPPQNGLLFDSDDAADLSHQIQSLLTDAELRETVAQGGYLTVTKKYSAETMADSYMRFYKQIACVSIK